MFSTSEHSHFRVDVCSHIITLSNFAAGCITTEMNSAIVHIYNFLNPLLSASNKKIVPHCAFASLGKDNLRVLMMSAFFLRWCPWIPGSVVTIDMR